MNFGKQIRLFLTDGSARGIRYAELMNWTGQAFSCPKGSFAKLKAWPETQRPGVYVLVGLNTDGKEAVYIGESENVLNRLLWHVSKSTLDDIVEAFFFTCKDDNLAKGHVTFLEQRLVKRAEVAKRYVVEYGREPSEKALSKPERATMEEFLENLCLVAAAMGYTVFESPETQQEAPTAARFTLVLDSGVMASGFPSEEGFVVTAGSCAKASDTESLQPGYKALKSELRAQGVLVSEEDKLKFAQDYTFKSSSAAAGVVAGSQRSGPQTWTNADGKSLREVEAKAVNANDEIVG